MKGEEMKLDEGFVEAMKAKYGFIYFTEADEENHLFNGKKCYECKNNKSDKTLAIIFWDKVWKQYCFTQADSNVLFSKDCLLDVVDFIKRITDGRL